jgi:uncharacterized protein YbjQ (UPF0145 family)
MILSTTESVSGKTVTRHLGLVYGNTIRARSFGRDIAAAFKMLAGGEISDYTKMMAESREQSLDRMIDSAKELGANAIIGIRFSTTSMMQGAAEIVIYGTAVVVE